MKTSTGRLDLNRGTTHLHTLSCALLSGGNGTDHGRAIIHSW